MPVNKNDFSRGVTVIFRKTVIVLSGLVLSLALLEGGLRLGGFIFSSMQAYENFQSSKQKNTYRILCLGESTTRRQYPHLLEQVLNKSNAGVRFSVIDKGKVGTNTVVILSRIETYLAEHHPNMVVAMMGNNDANVRYYQDIPESKTWLFRHSRAYRFSRILFMNILKKIKREGIYGLSGSDPRRKTKSEYAETTSEKANLSNESSAAKVTRLDLRDAEEAYGTASSYAGLGRAYLNQGKFQQAEEFLGKAIFFDPENEIAYAELKKLYRLQNKVFRDEDFFKKAIELDPANDRAYVGLGRFYINQKKLFQAEDSFEKAIELNPKNANAYVGSGWFYIQRDELSQAEDSFKKAIAIDPASDKAYTGLGQLYREQGKFQQAEDSFKKAIELNPKNDRAYAGLGWLYRAQGKFQLAEDSFTKPIEMSPENDYAYNELGRFYRAQGKFQQAEDSFKKPIKMNPENDNAYVELGRFYRKRGELSKSEDACRKAIELDPGNSRAYFELGWLYQEQGKFQQAEDSFKKAIELNPTDDRLLRSLVLLYEDMGKPDLAKEYAEKVNALRSEAYAPVTVRNYRKLKEILDRKGIKLVCVQYPVRNVDPLKEIFERDNGVIFVDNEKVFKEAVKQGGYKEYFRDMFSGDFGHCTPKGNMLLAQNIADVILREVFNK